MTSHRSLHPIVEEMQTYYARRAPIYDASMSYDRPETWKKLSPVIDHIRNLLRNRQVLELACGPAFWTQQICPVVKAVIATDYNDATLAEARSKNLDPEKAFLQTADAYDLPAFSERFDGCLAVDWFSHVPRSRFQGFLSGLHDRLAPGATIIFCDQLPRADSITDLHDEEGNHLQERQLPDGSTHRVIKHFLSDAEYREIFAPHTDTLRIRKFPSAGRIVINYALGH